MTFSARMRSIRCLDRLQNALAVRVLGPAAPSRRSIVAPSMAAADGEAGGQGAAEFGERRVLSIQSHVVSGYVGNKAATLPLQLLGFDVDPVMSVQFSNHTGYPTVRGKAFDGDHLRELLQGLEANGLIRHSHLLTGYMGTVSILEAVAAVARALRAANPGLTYVCDPVLGDEGKCYVSEELIGAYKSTILPLASILTPNQFEAELLTGRPITDEASALAACAALHGAGPHTVIITSMDAADEAARQGGAASAEQGSEASSGGGAAPAAGRFITLVASTAREQLPGRPAAFRVRIPRRDAYFTGTGDLLAALLLAWTARHPGDLATAVEKAVGGLQGVLAVTAAAAEAEGRRGGAAVAEGGGGGAALSSRAGSSAAAFRAKELRLVQAQGVLVAPLVELRAEPLAHAAE
ncbi:MAG: Ribokinase-like protein [Monoraphidium minutum]|nr:MAG: Ribokinase-like protein [Monoraphidium minutum]